MEGVIKKDVQIQLSTTQKKRQVVASQNFLKGARNFLIEYEMQVTKVIDIDGITKKYNQQMKSRVEQFKENTKQANTEIKKGQGSCKTIIFYGMIILGGVVAFKYAIQKIKVKYQEQIGVIKNIFSNVGNFIDKVGKLAKDQLGHNPLQKASQFINDAFMKFYNFIFKVLVNAMDIFFNGKSQINGGTRENMVSYLLSSVAESAMWRVLRRSNLITMLSWFGFSMVESIDRYANLKDFIHHGTEAVSRVTAIDAYANKMVNSDAYNKANEKWIDDDGNEIEIGDDSEEQQWNNVSKKIRQYHVDIIEKSAAAYSLAMRNDALGQEINPFSSEYMKTSGLEGVLFDTEWDWGSHSTAEQIYYNGADWTGLTQMMYDIERLIKLLKQMNVKQNIIKQAQKKQEYFWDKISNNKVTPIIVGQMIYVNVSLAILVSSRQKALLFNESVEAYYIAGGKYLEIIETQMKMQYTKKQGKVQLLDKKMMSGKISGYHFLSQLLKIVKRWSNVINKNSYLDTDVIFVDYKWVFNNNKLNNDRIITKHLNDYYWNFKRFEMYKKFLSVMFVKDGSHNYIAGSNLVKVVRSQRQFENQFAQKQIDTDNTKTSQMRSMFQVLDSLTITINAKKISQKELRKQRTAMLQQINTFFMTHKKRK